MQAICAISSNLVIGKDGKLPFHSKEDLKFFKELTLNKSIIVGRKTFESLPILKNRDIWVLTSKNPYWPDSKITGWDLKNSNIASIMWNLDKIPKDIIVCGGSEIYRLLLPKCSTLYLTEFDFSIEESGEIVKFPYNKEEINIFFPKKELIKNIENGSIYKYYK